MSTSTTDISALIPMLDAADAHPGAAALRARSYELLRAASGSVVADVGCGTGRAVAELTERGVRAVGIDLSEQMVAVARDRHPDADFRVGDAFDLPLGDGEAAGYRADKVIHILDDPGRALAEARRVLAPGGRIVLIGQDWDTIVIDSDDPALTRTIVRRRADLVTNPRAARAYRCLLLDAGFQDVTVEAYAALFTDEAGLPAASGMAEAVCADGAITRAQADGWIAEQSERARAGRFLMGFQLFVAAGGRDSG